MRKIDYSNEVVWIIGASSGIGAALARELAGRGATLALSARRAEDLQNLARSLGDQHRVFPLDVVDADLMLQTSQAIKSVYGRIDRAIFLAAAYMPMTLGALDLPAARKLVDVNIIGALNFIHAAMPVLKAQNRKAQIALCGSVAGYIGLPNGQPYSLTKAAMINLAESLYVECGDQIDVKLISPGFVRTPLTDKNDFHMPMMIEPEQAAKEIADGLLSNRFEISFPKKFTLLMRVMRLLPYRLSLYLTRKIRS